MIVKVLFTLGFFPLVEVTEVKILVKQPPLLVATNNEVNLVCNYIYNGSRTEFRASLQKGVDSAVETCSLYGNVSHQENSPSNKEFNCHGIFNETTMTFHLWDLLVNQTDIYFCKIEVMYPPPYYHNDKSNGTIIHVKEKLKCPDMNHQPPKPFWAIVAVVGALAFYSMLITVAFCNCWLRTKKNRILQSDYMNMTPRRPGPTKKQYQPYAPSRDFAAYRS
ncbi:T-cell-specific surface glycoprotein CD28 [Ornithorhynchus anatinus]|uniref:T-cell-specific surface glycoprotein CD28 n=1 Tax=Ornithorhynchus anatinus TaxID=9258 RepID=A0A6I8PCN1_ORNAN|nr:T-cell-specific surface glycoprotein CD28 [Ornithorhynchus anatinus]